MCDGRIVDLLDAHAKEEWGLAQHQNTNSMKPLNEKNVIVYPFSIAGVSQLLDVSPVAIQGVIGRSPIQMAN